MDSLKLNTEYAASLGAYWMIYAIAGSFASVFMLAKGYSNTHIGITIGMANLMALSLQPFVADHMDKVGGSRIIDALAALALGMMAAGTGYFIFGGGTFMLAFTIVVLLAIHAIIQPLLNTLAFRLGESGVKVSFGIGRAGGSLGYSAILAVLGTLVERKGVMAVPVCTEAACALFIALLCLTKYSYNRIKKQAAAEVPAAADAEGQAVRGEEDNGRIDLRSFIKRNKVFFIVNLGIAATLFSNSILSNYMPQIAGNVNGTTEQVGRILSLMALAEIPVMLFYDKINKHFSNRTLIKVSVVGLTVKIVVFRLARSVIVLYAAQILQFVGFAMLMPAMVYFINEIMSHGEAVKGQAIFTMMMTFATIGASLIGGWMLDSYGVKTLTSVASVVTAAGALVIILNVDKVKDHRRLSDD